MPLRPKRILDFRNVFSFSSEQMEKGLRKRISRGINIRRGRK